MLNKFDFLDKKNNSKYQTAVLTIFLIVLIIAVTFPNVSIMGVEGKGGISKDVRSGLLGLMGFVTSLALVPFWFILLDSYLSSMTKSIEIRQKQSQFIKRTIATLVVMAIINISMYLILKPSDSDKLISYNNEYVTLFTKFLWHNMNLYLLISGVLLGFSAIVGFVVEPSLHKQDTNSKSK